MIRGRMGSLVLAGAMLFSIAGVACGDHHAYRVYDPYYTDYHQWNGDETYSYRQWANKKPGAIRSAISAGYLRGPERILDVAPQPWRPRS